jgi:hypothetical protein
MNIEREIKRARKLQCEAAETLSGLKPTSPEFPFQEVDWGIAFARFAHDAQLRGRPWRRQKSLARQAYRTVLGLFPELTMTPEQLGKLKARLAKLRSDLRTLGVRNTNLNAPAA